MSVFTIQRVHETVSTIYQELFVIKFTHPGYENPHEDFINEAIRIVPDKSTEEVFKKYKIDYRFYTNTLVCFIECVLVNSPVREPKVPFVTIPADMQMRFLVTSSSDFAAKTYVVAAGSTHTYQFSNKINHTNGGLVLLTAPVEDYSITRDYEIGTLVQDGGNLFTTLKNVLAANHIPITDTAFWKQLQTVEQVVNNADLQSNAVVNIDSVCFAVIDMYKTGTTNSDYQLFDSQDQLFHPAPEFAILFKSRF
jgi:hypothetical protein